MKSTTLINDLVDQLFILEETLQQRQALTLSATSAERIDLKRDLTKHLTKAKVISQELNMDPCGKEAQEAGLREVEEKLKKLEGRVEGLGKRVPEVDVIGEIQRVVDEVKKRRRI